MSNTASVLNVGGQRRSKILIGTVTALPGARKDRE